MSGCRKVALCYCMEMDGLFEKATAAVLGQNSGGGALRVMLPAANWGRRRQECLKGIYIPIAVQKGGGRQQEYPEGS